MAQRIIPILPAPAAARVPPAWQAPRLVGDTQRAGRVLAALQSAVQGRAPRPDWLSEVRVEADEACVALSPLLAGAEGRWLAQAAFDTLRRLLPDTDIYVGAGSVTRH